MTDFLVRLAVAKIDMVGKADEGEEIKDTLTTDVTTIINNVILVLGLVCVVVMIIGGVNYMTSAGDSSKTKKGKDTILYGLIGLVVCALAFALVNWVIGGVLRGGSGVEESEGEETSLQIMVNDLG